ncbi:MAG: hypothetical protein FWH14_00310 [Oscillospiraceae bacterium]|nr:hypothetical protein [Oscillospiraceae bacterium]
MANTRNKVAIVFDGVVCRDDRPRSSVVIARAFLYPRYARGCIPYGA